MEPERWALNLLLVATVWLLCCDGQIGSVSAFVCPTCNHTCKCKCINATKSVACVKNKLMAVPVDLPADVVHLDLSQNRLTDLAGLVNLTSLTSLNLGNNQLSNWKDNWLTGLTSLTHLKLTHNELQSPPGSLCIILPKLRNLFMDDNKLSGSLPANYNQCLSLTRLTLSNNAFDVIDNSTLCSLGAAKGKAVELSLKLNRLKSAIRVQPGALGCLAGRLQSLDLGQNSLSQESLEGFIGTSGLGRLQTLSLKMSAKLHSVSPGLLSGLGALKVLALDGSRNLTELTSYAFNFTRDLYRLSLSRTKVAGWHGDCLDQLTDLQQLDLRNTSVSTIGGFNGMDINPLRLLPDSAKFASLDLTGAALACDCASVNWLARQLRRPAVLAKVVNANRLLCAYPEGARGRRLVDFDLANCDLAPPDFFTPRVILILALAGGGALALLVVSTLVGVLVYRRRCIGDSAGGQLVFDNSSRDPIDDIQDPLMTPPSEAGSRPSVWIRLRRLFRRGRETDESTAGEASRPPIYSPPGDYLDA